MVRPDAARDLTDPPGDSSALERILARAAGIVAAVAHSGQTLDTMLAEQSDATPAVRAIATGTVRWYLRLETFVHALAGTRLEVRLQALLVCALHQLEHSRTPQPTVVNAAVSAVRHLGLARARGLVNAVLRRFLREREELQRQADAAGLGRRTAHPQWLVDRITSQWGEPRGIEILEANNRPGPMTLRVNRLRISPTGLQQRLEAAGIRSSRIEWAPQALILERPRNVEQIPGFEAGLWSVQDAGAQLAADILDAQPGMRVLDACAAPGGKTGDILERTSEIELIANDFSAGRLARIAQNLDRLGLTAQLMSLDARSLAGLESGSFDRVLLDVPCSGTGVIRRHPDIKLLRRASDIASMAAVARQMLEAGFDRLRQGGRLVYATCSILGEENETLVEGFLAEHPEARPLPLSADLAAPPDAVRLTTGTQLLPGSRSDTDGFYYACIEKATTGH